MIKESGPVIIDDGESRKLKNISINEFGFDEATLQKLCYDEPTVLPIREIELIYEDMVPICMELQVKSGYCDIIYINRNGLITIVETKLWKNPESRRKVIG